ncbi:isochorismatase family protein [Streptomyces kronopolitis]
MSRFAFAPSAALVLKNLQKSVLHVPAVTVSGESLAKSLTLAAAFRSAGLPVVLVEVAWSPDNGDLLQDLSVLPGFAHFPPLDLYGFPAQLRVTDNDVIITKRRWGTFAGTELDLKLRRRGIKQIAFAGTYTSIGVESTGRSAWEHNYQMTFVSDSTTDTDSDAHYFTRTGWITTAGETIGLVGGCLALRRRHDAGIYSGV